MGKSHSHSQSQSAGDDASRVTDEPFHLHFFFLKVIRIKQGLMGGHVRL